MYKDNLYKLKVAAALAINVAADQIRPLEDTEHKLKTELSFVTRKLHQLRKDKDMYTKMHSTLAQLDKGAKLVLYCRSGGMGAIAARTLVKLGYSDVWNLDGGMIAWEEAGYPLVDKGG